MGHPAVYLTWSSALIALSAIIACGVADDRAERPQFAWSLGPLKVAIGYEETSDISKLILDQITVKYFMGLGGDEADKLLSRQIYREDLARCNNLFDETPEMESLIDCKPLNQHFPEDNLKSVRSDNLDASHSGNYVKRFSIALKYDGAFPLWSGHLHDQEHHFHLFEADHTRLTIDNILTKHNMTRLDLGSDDISTSMGFFVKSTIINTNTLTITCTANLFFIVNQTEAMPLRGISGGYQELMLKFDRLRTAIRENGGLLSVRDASCSSSIPVGSLDVDFTLIYRKQFPYITYSHTMITKPIEGLFEFRGSIEQVKNYSLLEGYRTHIDIQSLSGFFDALNFKIVHDFDNVDFASGSGTNLWYHPMQTLIGDIKWAAKSIYKKLSFYPSSKVAGFIKKTEDLGQPNLKFIFNDEPNREEVLIALAFNRKIWRSILERLGFANETRKPTKVYKVDFKTLPLDLRLQLQALVEKVTEKEERDEL